MKEDLVICPELSKLPEIKIKDINDLQGNFKELHKDNFDKLLTEIVKYGFKYPLFIYKDKEDGLFYNLDGNQRYRVISKTWGENIELPYVLVNCKSKKEAKKQILALNSDYGTINKEGFDEMVYDFETIDFEEIKQETTLDWLLDEEDKQPQEPVKAPSDLKITITCDDDKQFYDLFKEFRDRGIKMKIKT